MSEHHHTEHHEEAARGAVAAQLRLRHQRRAGDGAGVRRRRLGVAGASASWCCWRAWRRCSPARCRWGWARSWARAPSAILRARARARRARGRESAAPRTRRAARDLYEEGVRGRELERVVDTLTANEKRWVDVMMSEELGLSARRAIRRGRRGSWSASRTWWRRRSRFCPTCSSAGCAGAVRVDGAHRRGARRRRRRQGALHAAAAGCARRHRDDGDGLDRHRDLLGHRPVGAAHLSAGTAMNGAAYRTALVTGASSGIGRGLALALGQARRARGRGGAAARAARRAGARDRARPAAAPRRSCSTSPTATRPTQRSVAARRAAAARSGRSPTPAVGGITPGKKLDWTRGEARSSRPTSSARRRRSPARCRAWSRAARGAWSRVASVAGFRGLPRFGAYSASKAGLITLSARACASICTGPASSVTTVCPGYVQTRCRAEEVACRSSSSSTKRWRRS